MALFDCGVHVPGPLVVPRRFGLFTVATPITPDDPHWEVAGVTWDDDLCTLAVSTISLCPPDDEDLGKAPLRAFSSCCSEPFIVYGSYDCPPVGRSANAAFDTATRRLLAHEERAVEAAFWTGSTADANPIAPSLVAGNTTCDLVPQDLTPVSGAVSPVAAIATLESVLADCVPGVGVIHANYGYAAYLANANLLLQDERGYHTPTGQRISLGAGYNGTLGPDGSDPAPEGETWIFATGPVGIWQSEIFLTPPRLDEAVDRSLNNVRVFAERVYAVGFSCCIVAIRASLTDCC